MRLAISLVFVITGAACGRGEGGAVVCRHDGETLFPGDIVPAGDGCNICECFADGQVGRVACTASPCGDGGVRDAGSNACAADVELGCAGPFCEGICCGQGERCEFGQCTCGGGLPCEGDDLCASGGPIGNDACGQVCCGPISGPCPL